MNRLKLMALSLPLLLCCCHRPQYRIEGTVTAGVADGQKVYLVPMEGANRSNVDSTYAHQGKFVFEGDTERVSIIRLPIYQRLQAQDLLVVTEPGTIRVHLDANSTTGGTPQNDQMQRWKDAVIRRNTAYARYRQADNRHAPADSVALFRRQSDLADSAFHQLTRKIIGTSAGTTIARFLKGYL